MESTTVFALVLAMASTPHEPTRTKQDLFGFGLRAGTLSELVWNSAGINVLASFDATWRYDQPRFAIDLSAGARIPVLHERDAHLDLAAGLLGHLFITRSPRVAIGLGVNAVFLTGTLFVGRVGVEGDVVAQIDLRLVSTRRIDVEIGLRAEQAFASSVENGCFNLLFEARCEAIEPEYPVRVGLTARVAFF